MSIKNTSDIYGLILLMVISLVGAGCSAVPKLPRPNDPEYAPVEPSIMVPPRRVNGSIYQPPVHQSYTRVSFFQDRTARNVGDILTIQLAENTTAKKETETEIKKATESAIAEPTLFQRVTDFGFQTSVDNELDFKGEADTDQKNSLQGSITVTVTDVLPNGLLRVRGEKWIKLNRGDEYIRLSGMVRPEDISPDNSVSSTKVADARIAYSQTGELAHANTMGWLSRFFNSPVWPF